MTLRRDFLAFTAGAVAARTVLPVAARAEGVGGSPILNPDAELIAACQDYLRLQRTWDAYCSNIPGDIEEDDPGYAMLEPLAELRERIVSMRATTQEGFLARARCRAWVFLPGTAQCQPDQYTGDDDRMLAAELRDLVALEREGSA